MARVSRDEAMLVPVYEDSVNGRQTNGAAAAGLSRRRDGQGRPNWGAWAKLR